MTNNEFYFKAEELLSVDVLIVASPVMSFRLDNFSTNYTVNFKTGVDARESFINIKSDNFNVDVSISISKILDIKFITEGPTKAAEIKVIYA